jgi:hypothetical protein
MIYFIFYNLYFDNNNNNIIILFHVLYFMYQFILYNMDQYILLYDNLYSNNIFFMICIIFIFYLKLQI